MVTCRNSVILGYLLINITVTCLFVRRMGDETLLVSLDDCDVSRPYVCIAETPVIQFTPGLITQTVCNLPTVLFCSQLVVSSLLTLCTFKSGNILWLTGHGCDDGWLGSAHSDRCLWMSAQEVTFTEAIDACAAENALLVAPSTAFQQHLLARFLSGDVPNCKLYHL